VTVFQFIQAERYLQESLAALFASTGAERARARAVLRYEITRFRIARKAFFRSNNA
jgi:hypothetical protein